MMDKERGTVEALFCDFESLNFEMCKRERTIEEFENYEDGAWEQGKCNGRFLVLGPTFFGLLPTLAPIVPYV